MNARLVAAGLALACVWAAPARALGLVELMREAARAAHEARASEAAARAAQHEARAVEGAFETRMSAATNLRDERPPVLSSFQAVRRRSWQARANLDRMLSSGDRIGAELSVSRLDQRFDSPFAAQLATLNPAWQAQARIRLTSPLLAGRGNEDLASRRLAAAARAEQARVQAALARRNAALGALSAALKLLEDEARARLARDGLARARKLLDYQRMQKRLGLADDADLAAARALVAARRADLARARSALVVERTRLATLLDRKKPPRVEVGALPEVPDDAPLADLLAEARAKRPELAGLEAAIRAAQAAMRAARDADRMRLDLVAEAGGQGLAGTGTRAFGDAFSAKHPFFGIGLSLQQADPAARERLAAQAARLEEARARKAAFLEALADELREGRARLAAARMQLAAIREEAQAKQRRYEAELARYRQGRSRFPDVLNAEGELSRAQHALSLARLALVRARALLAFSLGRVP